jgi:hypothetical protein
VLALTIAMVVALLSYLISYHRHRTLLVEGTIGRAKEWRLRNTLPGWLSHTPREQAVVAFIIKTLARSSHHKMIFMGYVGLGFALFLTGVLSISEAFEQARVVAADFAYYHLLALLFVLIGTRHLFALPTELKANWIFQITEGEGRGDWLRAVDRLVLFWAVVPMLVVPLPLEIRLLGLRGIAEAALFLVLGLLAYEWFFFAGEKLPFTCSHLPGKTPIWMILAFFGLLGVLAVVHSLLVAILYNSVVFVTALAVLLTAWVRIHRTRRQGWAEMRLRYEETHDPAVQGLNLLN